MSDMALDDGAIALLIFLASLLLDYLLGDPWHWLHPVQVMGWVISAYTETALRLTQSPPLLRLLGVGLTLLMLLGSGGVAWGMIALGGWIHPGLAGAIRHSSLRLLSSRTQFTPGRRRCLSPSSPRRYRGGPGNG